LLNWMGSEVSYHDYIKQTWSENILGGSSFSQALHDGVFVKGSSRFDGLNGGSSETIETSTTELKDKKDRTLVGGIIHDAAVGIGIKDEDKDEFVTSTTTSTTTSENSSGALGMSVLSGNSAAKA